MVGAKEFLLKDDPDVAKNELIFPPADVMSRAHGFMAPDRGTGEPVQRRVREADRVMTITESPSAGQPGAGAVTDSMGTGLEIRSLTKRFGTFAAVDAIDLSVPEGSFFALLGPSGCGKTTTLRMVAGLEDPTAGAIYIGGTDVSRRRPYQRPVNTVFQNYALFPHLNVYENVAFGLKRRKVKNVRQQVMQMLELVELEHLAERKPTQLSGGQQQRIALVRALVNQPKVLLLDEPLGALDLKLRRQMQLELKRIQTEVGITFIHVTHDQEEAMTMADTIAVMNPGHIEQLGAPVELYENPVTVFVANFLGQIEPVARHRHRSQRRCADAGHLGRRPVDAGLPVDGLRQRLSGGRAPGEDPDDRPARLPPGTTDCRARSSTPRSSACRRSTW